MIAKTFRSLVFYKTTQFKLTLPLYSPILLKFCWVTFSCNQLPYNLLACFLSPLFKGVFFPVTISDTSEVYDLERNRALCRLLFYKPCCMGSCSRESSEEATLTVVVPLQIHPYCS